MQQEGVKPNEISFISVLNVCDSPESLALGKLIHASIVDSRVELDIGVGNALVSMYGRCGIMQDAQRMFNKIPERDVISWNVIIAGFVQNGHGDEALNLFQQMQWEGAKPDKFTFVSVLNACASLADLEPGKQIHAQITDSGFESDVFVGNALVDMYAKCG
eukprot:c8310_g1_i1 orf=1-483(+)